MRTGKMEDRERKILTGVVVATILVVGTVIPISLLLNRSLNGNWLDTWETTDGYSDRDKGSSIDYAPNDMYSKDSDHDGIPDYRDSQPYTFNFPDSDGDGIPDHKEYLDSDGDGLMNRIDPNPFNYNQPSIPDIDPPYEPGDPGYNYNLYP